ncbi:hypothetical protein BV372_34865 [Nostoc sp. T09]|uniref:hypothetical protein n=1 Tax=Nostoc sp. T09 TaxID=1932621 RepID=UPI000A39AE10|nr:hypothetical protein [Nostoc sp. T09]OUL17663.1 hypothetical protein BV372_34865 [Nostoc sp. T09]
MTSNQPNQPSSSHNNTPSQLDLNQLVTQQKMDLTLKPGKTNIDHFKEIIISLIALAGIAFIIYICSTVLQSEKASADDKKWAQSTITFIVGGAVGYITGKTQRD